MKLFTILRLTFSSKVMKLKYVFCVYVCVCMLMLHAVDMVTVFVSDYHSEL